MKKLIALLMCVLMLSFTACGSSGDSDPAESGEDTAGETESQVEDVAEDVTVEPPEWGDVFGDEYQ